MGQASRWERKEARLNHEVRRDRAEHDGRLTKGERAQINRQQNHLSHNIYRDKHG